MTFSLLLRAWLLWACSKATRIQQGNDGVLQKHAHGGKFGASCATLQTRFHMKVEQLDNLMKSQSGSGDMTFTARGRAIMKASAILRTLRRGSDCEWVAAGNSDVIAPVGKMLHSILADNPCAPAAMAELKILETGGDKDASALTRAMSILMSDDCKIDLESNEVDEIVDDDEKVVKIAQLVEGGDSAEIEEHVEDRVELIMEAEEAEGWTSSLVEQSQTQRVQGLMYFAKLMGAIILGVLFVLTCTFTGMMIGYYVAFFVAVLLFSMAGPTQHFVGQRAGFRRPGYGGYETCYGVCGGLRVGLTLAAGVGLGIAGGSVAMAPCSATFLASAFWATEDVSSVVENVTSAR